ncbi:hypothetical protein scyTo_0019815 [Scyliorhinus torazame]|uniref:Uncharacterized protein n=1 Tax=Scyliorhinus torazame TaxID=75743 RepID=A0A401PRV7_SCYTO|nr:hypothetical protein [Scyliorhinus torazame]
MWTVSVDGECVDGECVDGIHLSEQLLTLTTIVKEREISVFHDGVMWVCNLCRKQQEILTKSGAWFFGSGTSQPPNQDGALSDTATGTVSDAPREKKARLQERSRSQTPLSTAVATQETTPPDKTRVSELTRQEMGFEQKQSSARSRSEPPRDRKKSSSVSELNGKGQRGERKRVPKASLQQGQRSADEREHRERRESRRLEKGRSQGYQDADENLEVDKVPDEEKQRIEEEYQNRYKSDPNLARYPIKPQPDEQQMRINAKVSRARHERRHSDVSLSHTEFEEGQGAEDLLSRRTQQQRIEERKSPVEKTADGQMAVSRQQHLNGQSPPPSRRSPVPAEHFEVKDYDTYQKHLDPSSAAVRTKRERNETMLRNDSLSSDQSESIRPPPPKPHRMKKVGKKRQMSVSSSEEEGASTPEYTSCEDVEIESESVSEKGEHFHFLFH